MDMILEKIKSAGAKLITPKTKIEADGKGFFAIFIDLEGSRIGLHSKS